MQLTIPLQTSVILILRWLRKKSNSAMSSIQFSKSFCNFCISLPYTISTIKFIFFITHIEIHPYLVCIFFILNYLISCSINTSIVINVPSMRAKRVTSSVRNCLYVRFIVIYQLPLGKLVISDQHCRLETSEVITLCVLAVFTSPSKVIIKGGSKA